MNHERPNFNLVCNPIGFTLKNWVYRTFKYCIKKMSMLIIFNFWLTTMELIFWVINFSFVDGWARESIKCVSKKTNKKINRQSLITFIFNKLKDDLITSAVPQYNQYNLALQSIYRALSRGLKWIYSCWKFDYIEAAPPCPYFSAQHPGISVEWGMNSILFHFQILFFLWLMQSIINY